LVENQPNLRVKERKKSALQLHTAESRKRKILLLKDCELDNLSSGTTEDGGLRADFIAISAFFQLLLPELPLHFYWFLPLFQQQQCIPELPGLLNSKWFVLD
jgi:hypothetical protein